MIFVRRDGSAKCAATSVRTESLRQRRSRRGSQSGAARAHPSRSSRSRDIPSLPGLSDDWVAQYEYQAQHILFFLGGPLPVEESV